jgi:hypothetical protein
MAGRVLDHSRHSTCRHNTLKVCAERIIHQTAELLEASAGAALLRGQEDQGNRAAQCSSAERWWAGMNPACHEGAFGSWARTALHPSSLEPGSVGD